MKKILIISVLAILTVFNANAQCKKQSKNKTMDKLEILETISSYSFTWDEKKAEDLSNLFVEAGVWAWYRADGTKVLEMTDRKSFQDFAEQMFGNQLKGIATRHFQTNTIFVELSKTTAKTKTIYFSSGVILNGKVDMENQPFFAYHGVYEDEFIKVGGEWKFKVRKLITDN